MVLRALAAGEAPSRFGGRSGVAAAFFFSVFGSVVEPVGPRLNEFVSVHVETSNKLSEGATTACLCAGVSSAID